MEVRAWLAVKRGGSRAMFVTKYIYAWYTSVKEHRPTRGLRSVGLSKNRMQKGCVE